MTERGPEMRFADAGRPEDQNVHSLGQPSIAFRQCHDAGLADRGGGGEVEAVDGFPRGQSGLQQMPCGAPLRPLGDLVLEQGGEGLCRRPALAIGGLRDGLPEAGDRGQAELGEHCRQPGRVDGDARGGAHDANSAPAMAINRS